MGISVRSMTRVLWKSPVTWALLWWLGRAGWPLVWGGPSAAPPLHQGRENLCRMGLTIRVSHLSSKMPLRKWQRGSLLVFPITAVTWAHMVVQAFPWIYHHVIYSCKQFPHSAGEQSWVHTGASATWFVGALCAAKDTVGKKRPSFCGWFSPPGIFKARRACVLHTIKLYQEIAASSL